MTDWMQSRGPLWATSRAHCVLRVCTPRNDIDVTPQLVFIAVAFFYMAIRQNIHHRVSLSLEPPWCVKQIVCQQQHQKESRMR